MVSSAIGSMPTVARVALTASARSRSESIRVPSRSKMRRSKRIRSQSIKHVFGDPLNVNPDAPQDVAEGFACVEPTLAPGVGLLAVPGRAIDFNAE